MGEGVQGGRKWWTKGAAHVCWVVVVRWMLEQFWTYLVCYFFLFLLWLFSMVPVSQTPSIFNQNPLYIGFILNQELGGSKNAHVWSFLSDSFKQMVHYLGWSNIPFLPYVAGSMEEPSTGRGEHPTPLSLQKGWSCTKWKIQERRSQNESKLQGFAAGCHQKQGLRCWVDFPIFCDVILCWVWIKSVWRLL